MEGVEKVDSFEVKNLILSVWVIKEVSCCKFEIYLVGGNTKFTAWQLPQSKFKMYMTEVKKQEINK